MIKEIIKIGINHTIKIEEFSIGKIDLGMNKITGMIIGEETLEVTGECIKILEERIIEEEIEGIIGVRIITEKEIGIGL